MTTSPLFSRLEVKTSIENGVPAFGHFCTPEDNYYGKVDSFDLERETFSVGGYSFFILWEQVTCSHDRIELGSNYW